MSSVPSPTTEDLARDPAATYADCVSAFQMAQGEGEGEAPGAGWIRRCVAAEQERDRLSESLGKIVRRLRDVCVRRPGYTEGQDLVSIVELAISDLEAERNYFQRLWSVIDGDLKMGRKLGGLEERVEFWRTRRIVSEKLAAEWEALTNERTAERDRLEAELMVLRRAGDALVKVIDQQVQQGTLNARSAIADARLDYGEPFKYSS